MKIHTITGITVFAIFLMSGCCDKDTITFFKIATNNYPKEIMEFKKDG